MLTCRQRSNTEACSGFVDWAQGFAAMVAEHALSPVLRIGAVAWLARVALRPDEGVARVPRPFEEDATCVAVPSAEQAAWVQVQDLHARPHVRHCIALEAAGWHIIELRPSSTDDLALWRVTIERYDGNMTMTVPGEADPDAALEELVRHVQVDAR
jgi:hypothetical protein